jgi:hypothetical protein
MHSSSLVRATCPAYPNLLELLYFATSTSYYLIMKFYTASYYFKKSRDSVVGVGTGNGLDDRGTELRVPVGARIFSSPYRPDRL